MILTLTLRILTCFPKVMYKFYSKAFRPSLKQPCYQKARTWLLNNITSVLVFGICIVIVQVLNLHLCISYRLQVSIQQISCSEINLRYTVHASVYICQPTSLVGFHLYLGQGIPSVINKDVQGASTQK